MREVRDRSAEQGSNQEQTEASKKNHGIWNAIKIRQLAVTTVRRSSVIVKSTDTPPALSTIQRCSREAT